MRQITVRWIGWVCAGVLLCTGVTTALVLLAPQWSALQAGYVSDGGSAVAVAWDGNEDHAHVTADLRFGGSAAVPEGMPVETAAALTVVPAADWYVRPGLTVSAPDGSVRVQLSLHTRGDAEQLWETAIEEWPAGERREQRETLVTGAQVHTVSSDAQTRGILELPCASAPGEESGEPVAPEPQEPVLWVVVDADSETDLQRTRVALGQLLETVCASAPVSE